MGAGGHAPLDDRRVGASAQRTMQLCNFATGFQRGHRTRSRSPGRAAIRARRSTLISLTRNIDDPRYHESVILAAELIQDARRRSGLTQAELARRAGLTQSVISAYENGHRDPSFTTLQRVISATGFMLEPMLVPRPKRSALAEVRSHAADLRAALSPLGALDIRIFGSVARGDETDESDVDLLVELASDVGVFNLLRMQEAAEQLLGRSVDIVPSTGIKPDAVERITHEAVPL